MASSNNQDKQPNIVVVEKNEGFMSVSSAILIGSILISFSILLAGGVVKLKGLNSGINLGSGNTAQVAPSPAVNAPAEVAADVKVSVDDDPVLGDKNAPVTLIEFSDYECPFCKRHFIDTFPDIKKNYIDTGKVKLVYRDLPLSFHDPMATTEAIAANCIREQGGDDMYFKYHDLMFAKTTSNGTGLSKDDLSSFAAQVGANVADFNTCLTAEKYKAEVTKDITDGNAAGATGTPSFFVGKSSSDGMITGTIVVGAQPYSVFQTLFDEKLK